jgi:hypothetical protein
LRYRSSGGTRAHFGRNHEHLEEVAEKPAERAKSSPQALKREMEFFRSP